MVLAHSIDQERRTQDVKITQNITFETMLLSDFTLEGLKSSGFHKPSPIQLQGIPLGKCGFDLLLEAKSGTGKTAVFTVIALEKINLNNGLQAVILAPTREIAAQICDVIKQIGENIQHINEVFYRPSFKVELTICLAIEVVMGGLPVKDDITKFKKKVHIVVGSPGRLHHLIRDNHIDVSAVRLLVLDEADKLMEKSFRADIEYIFSALPLQKQIIFSSATFPEESKAFINDYVQVSQHICPDSNSVLLGISQKVTTVKHNTNIVKQTQYRFEELLNILTKKEFKQCLIFCNYQARVTDVHKMLRKAEWPAEKLYGQQEQLDRLEALKTLQDYRCRILIATDLAARGLDSSHVDLVINFEMPYDWQTYLHRIGRAGRFGAYGLAVTIVTHQEETKFKELLNSMHFQIVIRNFWSDKEFKYTEDDSKTPIPLEHTLSLLNLDDEMSNEEDYSEIWNMLTGDTKCSNAIETFDMLCSSFIETKEKIETFTDLIDSFQRDEHDNVESSNEYQCLTQTIVKFKEYKKQVDFPLDKQVKKELESGEASSVENSHHIIEPKCEIIRRKPDNITINRHKKLEKPQRKLHSKNKKYISSEENEIDNIHPNSYPHNEQNLSSEESDDKGYNTASYDFMKSQYDSANNENNTHTSKNNKYSYKHRSHNDHLHQYTSNYIQWYNALKLRTKQVEMAIYLNEMSQL